MRAKEKTTNTWVFVIESIALTIAGFMIIPPILEKCANKAYKASLKKERIDFDDMGPEIVEKKSEEV